MKISIVTVLSLLAVTNASSNAGVDFYEYPVIYTATSLVHGALEFRLLPIKSLMSKVELILSRFSGRHEYRSMTDILEPQVRKTKDLFSEVKLLTLDVSKATGRPSQMVSENSRKKRFVAALASVLGLGIGSLLGYEVKDLFSSGNSAEVNSRLDNLEYCLNNAISKEEIIGQELEENRKAINDIYRKMNNTAQVVNEFFVHVVDLIKLNQISNNLIELLNDYKSILIAGLQNKISQKLLTHAKVNEMVKNVKKVVPAGYQLVTENFAEIMQLGASASIEEHRFFLVIHFPIFKIGSDFKSFLVRQRPFMAGSHFLKFNAPNDVLAISPKNDYYFEAKKYDLDQQCIQLLGKYFCNHITQWNSDFESSCLYQLHQNKQKEASRICNMITIPKKETIVEIKAGLLKWFYPQSRTVHMKCPNKKLLIPVVLASDNTYQFTEKTINCHIISGKKRIRPTHQLNLPTQVVSYSYDIEPKHFEDRMSSLSHLVSTDGNTSHDLKVLENVQHIPRVKHTIIAAGLGGSSFGLVIILIIVVGAIFAYKKCKKNKKKQGEETSRINQRFTLQTIPVPPVPQQTIIQNHLPQVNFDAKNDSVAIDMPSPAVQNVYAEPQEMVPAAPISPDPHI